MILLYGGNQAIEGAIAIGVVVAFVGYLQTFFDPIQQLSQLYTTYQQGMAALDKIFDLLETRARHDRRPGRDRSRRAARGDRARGRLLLLRATTRSQPRPAGERVEWALDEVDLQVPPGQTVALVGATGAGKSTFAKLVARFYDPQRGRVLIDGHDLRGCAQQALRGQLGIVPQEGFLFSGTVRENIAFGRPEASSRRSRRRRRPSAQTEFIAALPEGIETEVGERGRPALGRPAPAGRLRAGAAGRAADPDPRRGDLERRRPHREGDRARPGAAARRAHRDRDRPPASRRSAAPARSSCWRTAGSPRNPRGAAEAGGAYARLYGAWAEIGGRRLMQGPAWTGADVARWRAVRPRGELRRLRRGRRRRCSHWCHPGGATAAGTARRATSCGWCGGGRRAPVQVLRGSWSDSGSSPAAWSARKGQVWLFCSCGRVAP